MAKGSPRSLSFLRGKSSKSHKKDKHDADSVDEAGILSPTPPSAPPIGTGPSPRSFRLFKGAFPKSGNVDIAQSNVSAAIEAVADPPVDNTPDDFIEEEIDPSDIVVPEGSVSLQPIEDISDAGIVQEEAQTLRELRHQRELAHMSEEERQHEPDEFHEADDESRDELLAQEAAAMEQAMRQEEERLAAEAEAREDAAREEAHRLAIEEKAREEAKLDAMTEDELLDMQLKAKLSKDLSSCKLSLSKVFEELKETDSFIATLNDDTASLRSTEKEKISKIMGRLHSYNSMLHTVEGYNAQCTALKSEAAALVSKETQMRLDTHGISGRVREELVEAQERLNKQNTDLTNMRNEMAQLIADTSRAEKQLGEDLSNFSSDAAAKKLKYDLSEQQLELLCSEQARRMEITDDLRKVEQKKSQVASTLEQVTDIKAQIDIDEQAITTLKAKEAELEQQNQVAEGQIEAHLRGFKNDKDTLRSLAAMQNAFLGNELATLTAQGAALHTTKAEVLEKTKNLVTGHGIASETQLHEVQAQQEKYVAAMKEERRKRDSLLRQHRAERKAIEISTEERRAYLADKERQLEVEEKQLFEANCELNDHRGCILMLQSEIELAQGGVNERKTELEAAEALKADCKDHLESLKMKNKLRATQLRVRVDSETRVQVEQEAYISSLQNRLKVETESIAEQSAQGTDAWKDAAVPPVGKQGLEMTVQNEAAMQSWSDELKQLRDTTDNELSSTVSSLESAEKRAATEVERFESKRTTLRHEAEKLAEYEGAISAKLAGSNSSNVVTTPIKTKSPRSVLKTPSTEDLKTPYGATHKYLHTSHDSTSDGVQEEHDPKFNPDLKYEPNVTTSPRGGFRSRIGMLSGGTRLFEKEQESPSALLRV